MKVAFIVAFVVAVISTVLVISGKNAIHALLNLILSLLSVAVIFFLLGAPFAAALEVIIYAGAIMVLFVFAVMMLNLGKRSAEQERKSSTATAWILPIALAGCLFVVFLYAVLSGGLPSSESAPIGPQEVGLELFGPYLCLVELASILLLTGLLGAYHIGRRETVEEVRTGRRPRSSLRSNVTSSSSETLPSFTSEAS